MPLANETGGSSLLRDLTDGSGDGTRLGQSASDPIGFFGLSTPIVQPTSATDAITALQNLGLLASGTYTITGQYLVSTNETGTTASSVTALAATGWSKVNSTVAYTYFLSSPIKGTEKYLYVDKNTTAVLTIKANSTEVASSLIYISAFSGSTNATSASSIGSIVITSSQPSGGGQGISLIAASSVEWVVKMINSTAFTFTT